MANKKRQPINARDLKIQTRAAAVAEADAASGSGEYPKAKYRRTKPSPRFEDGIEVKRIENEDEESRLDPTEWFDSPADVPEEAKKPSRRPKADQPADSSF